MASISKQPNGTWRAAVFKNGTRKTKVLPTKREAESWASKVETEIEKAVEPKSRGKHTVTDALTEYRDKVSPLKGGARWETVRINAFIASGHALFRRKIRDVQPEHLAEWRDYRLQSVSDSAVRREFSLMSAVFETARKEWKWISSNPVHDVRKPKESDHREVLITASQIHTMCKSLGYTQGAVKTVRQAVAVCFLVALRTGCRAGELTSLTWDKVSEKHFTVNGKTGKRDVPLTTKCKRLFDQVRGFDDKVFGLTPQTLDALFRRARDKAGLSGFTFHDTRHTACTRIVKYYGKKLDVLTFCRMMGWSNPKMAMVYFNMKASEIADILN